MPGWDRASFEMNTRPIRVERDISRRDLMLPSRFGPALFAECLACGVLVGAGFFWGPLTIAAVMLGGGAPWFWPTMACVCLTIALLMLAYVRHDVKDLIDSIDES